MSDQLKADALARVGNGRSVMVTASGAMIDFDQPELGDYRLDDVAQALSQINRYNGHTNDGGLPKTYSVARHALNLWHYCQLRFPDDHLLAVLAIWHDAVESVVGDLIAPLKRDCPEYQATEAVIQAVMTARLLPELAHVAPEVLAAAWRDLHEYDQRIRADEMWAVHPMAARALGVSPTDGLGCEIVWGEPRADQREWLSAFEFERKALRKVVRACASEDDA